MICKIVLATLFAVCQGANNEPWWIQMFFPNVSFTGKYHPSNYKVEKSPLFPAYAQNPNDVWSPAYWMPYKLAHAQYWIDLIDNTTKAEQQKAKEAQAETAQTWGNYQNGQFGMAGYSQSGQMGMNGQYGQFGQTEMNPQSEQNKPPENNGVSTQSTAEHSIVEEAGSLAKEVHAQAEKMTQEAELIAAQVAKDAENQMLAVAEEAEKKKQQVQAEVQLISSQAEIVAAEIDKAAQAEIEAIAQEHAQFQEDLKSQFEPLFDEAEEILMEASELAEEVAEKNPS